LRVGRIHQRSGTSNFSGQTTYSRIQEAFQNYSDATAHFAALDGYAFEARAKQVLKASGLKKVILLKAVRYSPAVGKCVSCLHRFFWQNRTSCF